MPEGRFDGAVIVFDLDGTLVDTAPDLLRALRAVMRAEGLPEPDEGALRRMVGQGARALIMRASAAAGVEHAPEKLTALTETFVEIYRADIAAESRPFPGAVAAIDALRREGARCAVCTNKRTDLSVRLLEVLEIADRFAAIVGSDSVPARKPDPGHYVAAVERAGGQVSRSLMVGDSAPDIMAARAAGAPAIGVRFGYCDGDVEDLGADALIGDFKELPTVAGKLLGVA